MSQSTVSQIENDDKAVSRDQAELLDGALDSEGQLVSLWTSVVDGFRVPDWYRKVPEMEQRATEIQQYHPLVVPGLLQTEEYAKATIRAGKRTIPADELAARAAERVERQEVLTRESDPPFLLAVICETVLQRPLGRREVMQKQLEHLYKASQWDNVEILVVPHPTWNHPGLDGGFRLLKLPDAGTVLYLETRATGGIFIDSATVDEHVSLLGDLRGAALPSEPSRALIERARGEFT